MSNLILLEEDEGANMNVCKICVQSQGKYTCPRCGICYCSLVCYQSDIHGDCSEEFYRECVLNEMKLEDGDAEAEKKMKDILHRFQQSQQNDADNMEELDSDDEFEPDLADRMSSINLDDPDSIWAKLTPAEKQEFEELLRNGDVTELLPTWKPWWNYRVKQKLVVDIECEPTTSTELETYVTNCPPLKSVKPLSQITRTQPADVVKFNALNVVAAYCYVARWYNGEHQSLASEAAQALATLSRNLSGGNNYASTELAVEAVALEATTCSWLGGCPETVTAMRQDLAGILAGPEDSHITFYLEAALSDVHALLSTSASNKSQAQHSKSDGEFARRFPECTAESARVYLPREKLKHCVKKVEYYLSWAKDHGTEICGVAQEPAPNRILTTDDGHND